MGPETQDADLRSNDGSIERVQLPAFPENPELVKTDDGRFFIADSPVIGYGTTSLSYHAAEIYEIPA